MLHSINTAKANCYNITHICPFLHQDALGSSRRHEMAEREQAFGGVGALSFRESYISGTF